MIARSVLAAMAISLSACTGATFPLDYPTDVESADTLAADTAVTDVVAGGPDGLCYPNGTCNAGATCSGGHCVAIPDGALGGLCFGNHTCFVPLVCDLAKNSCVEQTAADVGAGDSDLLDVGPPDGGFGDVKPVDSAWPEVDLSDAEAVDTSTSDISMIDLGNTDSTDSEFPTTDIGADEGIASADVPVDDAGDATPAAPEGPSTSAASGSAPAVDLGGPGGSAPCADQGEAFPTPWMSQLMPCNDSKYVAANCTTAQWKGNLCCGPTVLAMAEAGINGTAATNAG